MEKCLPEEQLNFHEYLESYLNFPTISILHFNELNFYKTLQLNMFINEYK